MLQITNLTTSLLTDINLTAKAGQIVAITGDNGCGKSTLAKVISGYYQFERGTINLDPSEIGLLTQNPYLQFIGNTVFDELTYSLEQAGASAETIEQILDDCPFELTKNLEQLSGGEAQRLLIYKELQSPKQLLILDETLSNLDAGSKRAIIDDLKASSKAVILITNNLNDTRFADVVYRLLDGELKLSTSAFTEPELLPNLNPVAIEYQGYQFKTGLNIVTGASAGGKTTLITSLCFDQPRNISLIPQYPFEIVTTLDATHVSEVSVASKINLDPSKFEQNITELSTGELVKVLIVEAVLSGNKTLVLDEAIEVLDQASQQLVLDLISEVFETVIIVTHNRYLFNDRQVHIVEVSDETNNN